MCHKGSSGTTKNASRTARSNRDDETRNPKVKIMI